MASLPLVSDGAPCLQVKTDGIPEPIVEELIAQSKELQAGRKQKTYVSETLATAEEVQRMALTSSHPLHKTTQVRMSPVLSSSCLLEVLQHSCCRPWQHGNALNHSCTACEAQVIGPKLKRIGH